MLLDLRERITFCKVPRLRSFALLVRATYIWRMEHWWSGTDRGKPKYWERNRRIRTKTEALRQESVPLLLCAPETSQGLTCDRTRVSPQRDRRLAGRLGHGTAELVENCCGSDVTQYHYRADRVLEKCHVLGGGGCFP